VLWTVPIGSIVALGQTLAVVHHGANGHRQLEDDIPLGLSLQRNIARRLDLLKITG